MSEKPSSSLSGLISIKGSAAAATPAKPEPVKIEPAPLLKPMPEKSQPKGGQSYWKAMTVKLNRDQYVDLKIHGVKLNKSSQDCISEAIDMWLAAQSAD
uniref:Putative partitioning protein ParB n=1 Tax=Polaromonas sp. H6N TaxID=1840293 RepID=A0A2S1FIB7_9BURK|nr:hypothetical protein [Polaromonas sp. H6N]AWD72261.1 putative partitioning protein ParB [Polaromonas sp. H6N]